MNSKIQIGYWGIQGIAEPLRWLASYVGLDVEYVTETDTWFTEGRNNSLGFDFPNLPYLIDGDYKLTESSAIPVYLALKAGRQDLLGATVQEQATLRMLEGIFSDLRSGWQQTIFCENNHAESVSKFLCKEKGDGCYALHKLSAFLGKKEFFLGHITIFDFAFAYFLPFILVVAKSLNCAFDTKDLQNLVAHSERISQLPKVKEIVQARAQVPRIPPGMLKFELKP